MEFEVVDTRPTDDPIVNNVINRFSQRSKAGMLKYGQTMADNPLNAQAWIKHAQEELMDAILYLERLWVEITNKEF